MGRARRARRIAASAAYGGGGLAATLGTLGAVGYGVIKVEAAIARRVVGHPLDEAPEDDATYGCGIGDTVEIVVLGDSSAAGLGADTGNQTVGAIIANGLAALTGRPVRLTNESAVGAQSADLDRQLANALDRVEQPHLAIILIGANDVTHRIDRATSVRHLETVVRRLRALSVEVVVGTCPDLGTIEPIPVPLKHLVRRWSRDLAAAQTVAVVEAGGRTVSLGDLLGPEFEARPRDLFSLDQFHPSPAGYARVAAVLLPTVCAALGVWGEPERAERRPSARRGGAISPVAVAAGHAVNDPGTEVSGTALAGIDRGPRGRWALLLRRRQAAVPPQVIPVDDAPSDTAGPASGTATRLAPDTVGPASGTATRLAADSAGAASGTATDSAGAASGTATRPTAQALTPAERPSDAREV